MVLRFLFTNVEEILMSTQAAGNSGALVFSGSSPCYMAFGILSGASPTYQCPVPSLPGLCGYPTWVMPINYTLQHFNVGMLEVILAPFRNCDRFW
jgi:hypothetical protein